MKTIKNILVSLILGCGLLQPVMQLANPTETVQPTTLSEEERERTNALEKTPRSYVAKNPDMIQERYLRVIPVIGPIVGTCLVRSSNTLHNKLGYAMLAATGVLDYLFVKNFAPSKGAASVLYSLMLAGPLAGSYLIESPSLYNKALGYALCAATGLVDGAYTLDVILS